MSKSRKVKTAMFYLALFAVGVILYSVAHLQATQTRGYEAYGGEVAFLLLPVLAYIIRSCIADIKLPRKVREENAE